MKLLVATTNPNKVRELMPIVAHIDGIEWLTLRDLPSIPEPPESGSTYWENAREKALAYARASGLTVVAEDSGFEVNALDGIPGVQSARFLGADVSYPDRFAEIKKRLAAANATNLDARFVTAIAAARGDEILFETEAYVEGEVAGVAKGDRGFGYDPLFLYTPLGKTTGELIPEEKGAVSHRARAFRDFARWLASTPFPAA